MVGHHISNVESIQLEFICIKCNLLLREPRQTPCGHRLCKPCVEFEIGDTFRCPAATCENLVQKNQVFIDRGVSNDMKFLDIGCKWCCWNGQFKDYENHLQASHNSPRCPSCSSEFMSWNALRTHISQDCTRISFPCGIGNLQQTPMNLQGESQTDASIMRYRSLTIPGSRRVTNYFSPNIQSVTSSPRPQTTVDSNTDEVSVRLSDRTGKYIWRIVDVESKTQDAKNGIQTSIDSPAFYSSDGYKLCLRLNLDGDESVRSRYLSFFIVLMQGDNDHRLEFPFRQKVLICLYDQTDEKNHVITGFRPNTTSRSFSRPTTEKNPASGIPKLFPLKKLRETGSPYVYNDTIFIKVFICDEYVPESAIKRLMNINPGLSNVDHDREKRRIIDEAVQEESDDLDKLLCVGLF